MLRTSATGVQATVLSRRVDDGSAVPFNVLVSCSAPAGAQIDITSNLVAAVAHSLWEARGGDPVTNWVDAEGVVAALLSPAVAGAAAPMPEPKPRAGTKPAPAMIKRSATKPAAAAKRPARR